MRPPEKRFPIEFLTGYRNWRENEKLVSLLLLVAIMISLVGCAAAKREEAILETLENFEESCRRLDIDGILNCLNPTYARPISTAKALLGALTDINADELLQSAFELLFNQKGADPEEFLSAVTLENAKVSSEKTSAKIEADLTAKIAGQKISYGVEIGMKYDEDEDLWFISGIDFVK